MKVATVLGTRPEIIRLSLVIRQLDAIVEHVLIHTGQNYDERLTDVFFRELGVRAPDVYLGVRGDSFGAQVGQLLERIQAILDKERPDRVLVLGDTNSGLSAIVARRLGIPVYHMEAGNRAFDDRVPEEINRRIIDHSSSVLLPYSNRSRDNLLREGIASSAIYVTGNPIWQVIRHYASQIEQSSVLSDCHVTAGQFFLATVHRAENVDRPARLAAIIDAFEALSRDYGMPVLCSVHPRTRAQATQHGIRLDREGLAIMEPFGFFDFIKLERSAFCTLSDSGTVQEEACLLGTPNVTIREVTERPETVECGSNFVAGTDPEAIRSGVATVMRSPAKWRPPAEYLEESVADTVVRIVTSFRIPDLSERERRVADLGCAF